MRTVVQVGTSPRHLEWLRREVVDWRQEGLISDETAGAILRRYVPVRRFGLLSVVSALGAVFMVAGFLWLVISNLGRFGPAARVVLVGGLWLAVAGLTEWMARRAGARGDRRSPLVGALRLLVAGGLGGVVYLVGDLAGAIDDNSVWWLGAWATGALVYGYARDAVAAVLLGAVLLVAWYAVKTATDADSAFAFTGAALVAGAVAAAVAALQLPSWARRHEAAWSWVSAAATVIGMFAAGIPFERGVERGWPTLLLVGLGLALALAGLAVVRRPDRRVEIAVAVGALALGLPLSAWAGASTFSDGRADPGTWARAAVSVLLFLIVSGGVLALGTRRDAPVLTTIAAGGLVAFMTFQGFAVFAEILSGAALFLTVGAVLIGTAFLVDRARRALTTEFADPPPGSDREAGHELA